MVILLKLNHVRAYFNIIGKQTDIHYIKTNYNMVKHKANPLEKSNENISLQKELILHNDDINTFDFVISTLIDVCKHEKEQAEQCAMIIHYKGKCSVKTGFLTELEPLHTEVINRGLSATIE